MSTLNRFRAARGRLLSAQIAALAVQLGRPIDILDVGGRAEYWGNVGYANVRSIAVMNVDEQELCIPPAAPAGVFSTTTGDARCLLRTSDQSIDLVHSNSVIEHVGAWRDMLAMASEVRRVGRSGWIQTPAWEFPIEPHFRAPFLHWFGQPLRRRMLWLSSRYRRLGVSDRRAHVDRINLLSRGEVAALFPGCDIWTERLVFPKSYVARWTWPHHPSVD